jgi:hypothetical protein
VSGDAANVHPIGWMNQAATYRIRFDAENIDLLAAVGRMSLTGLNVTTYGLPEFSSTTASPGTMALWVGGNGQAGCYRYQVALVSPGVVPITAPERIEPSEPFAVDAPAAEPTAIAGLASSARHCVSGSFRANVHEIGRIEQNNRVTITFDSDFNPIAGAALIHLAARSHAYYSDDNSGGSNQPRLSFTAPHGGTLALYVAAATSTAGCYRYKVEIQ